MKLPKDQFVSNDGTLHKWQPQRGPIATKVLRVGYATTHPTIADTLQLRATLRNGSVSTWGSYTLMLLTSDGGALCYDCARENYRDISTSVRYGYNDGWRVVATICESDYDNIVHCDHCHKCVIGSEEQ